MRALAAVGALAWLALAAACSTTGASSSAEASRGKEAKRPPEIVDVTASAEAVEVGADVEPDAEVVAFLAPRAEHVRARAGRVVGKLAARLERGKPESTMGNFVTDAMRDGMGRVTGKKPDVCFTNLGGLRRDVEPGEVTEGVLVELMPFDNSVVVFTATTAQLTAILERVAERGDPVAGVSYARDGGRLVDARVDGKPLAERSYTVCTNDYIFEGGGKYPFEGVSRVSYTGVLLRDVLVQAFELEHKKGRAVKPRLDGRVKEGK